MGWAARLHLGARQRAARLAWLHWRVPILLRRQVLAFFFAVVLFPVRLTLLLLRVAAYGVGRMMRRMRWE